MSLSAQSLRMNGQSLRMSVQARDLDMGRQIGSGACSSVRIAKHKTTGELFAVKMFNVYDRERKKQFEKELGVLLRFNCDCLVNFFGVSYSEGTVGLILEFMDCGSLDCLMDRSVIVPELVMAAISFQILWGLAYLHHDHNIHRDLKPGNVLMNRNGEVKLSDFGIFRSLADTVATSETFTGTYKFMSPERLDGKAYNEAADVWSLGVMILQIWRKKYPFDRGAFSPLELLDVLENTETRHFVPDDVFPSDMADCLCSMLTFDPEKRASAIELMESRWMRGLGMMDVDVAQAVVQEWISTSFPTGSIGPAENDEVLSSAGMKASADDDDDDTSSHGAKGDDRPLRRFESKGSSIDVDDEMDELDDYHADSKSPRK